MQGEGIGIHLMLSQWKSAFVGDLTLVFDFYNLIHIYSGSVHPPAELVQTPILKLEVHQ